MTKARNIADLGSNDVIETTSTGVDVTGTVTADGLTVDGLAIINGASADFRLNETDTTDLNTRFVSASGALEINTLNDAGNSQKKRVKVDHTTGDVSFYEDTGTTAKMVWDASAESLGVGGSPSRTFDVSSVALGLPATSGTANLGIARFGYSDRAWGGCELNQGIENNGSYAYWFQAQVPTDLSVNRPISLNPNGGNVGIGSASPSEKLDINGGTSYPKVKIQASTQTSRFMRLGMDSATEHSIEANGSSTSLLFKTVGTERARITSSGSFLINTSGVLTYGDAILQSNGGSNNWGATFESSATSASRGAASFVVQNTGAPLARFHYVSTSVGDITTNGTAVSYGSNSDYRLKENVTTITDASERLKALKPCRFNFISHPGKTVDGFLAHEAQEVVPEAVTGTKDAMRTEEYEVTPAVEATYDEDGNELTPAVEAVMGTREVPDYQGIDQSKLVPLLTKALQEALTRIEALENANGNS